MRRVLQPVNSDMPEFMPEFSYSLSSKLAETEKHKTVKSPLLIWRDREEEEWQ